MTRTSSTACSIVHGVCNEDQRDPAAVHPVQLHAIAGFDDLADAPHEQQYA